MARRHRLLHATMRVKSRFSAVMRRRRMAELLTRMPLRPGDRVIDLGGAPAFWAGVETPLDITVLNLPGAVPPIPAGLPHRFTLIEGDACAVDFPDESFDAALSNSVIEHVGDAGRQRALAGEARRLARRYWVQTPSIWFPIEAHTNMPFWWFYPEALRLHFIRGWRQTLPAWCAMVEGTTVISRRDMRAMFPDATLWTERFAGIPKSYVAYRA